MVGILAQQHSHHDSVLNRAIFASCNSQRRDQPLWTRMSMQEPDAFFWMGDAVYPNRSDVVALRSAFATQEATPDYAKFVSGVALVDGTWDDHDLGVNDGGRNTADIDERRRAYNAFLGRQAEDLMYKSHSFDDRVLVVLLDTRSYRDDHMIPSVGAWFRNYRAIGRLAPLVAAWTRLVSGYFHLAEYFGFEGDVLGEEQWSWLEKTLAGTKADFVVVVSSIQFASQNPSFETWAHFPKAKRRMLDVLERTRPKGLVFLSGDVHHAEITGTDINSCGDFVEITSSGLTHSLATSRTTSVLFPPLLRYFSTHRPHPSDYSTSLNYALVTFDWDTPHPYMTVTVHGLDKDPLLRPVTVFSCPYSPSPSREKEEEL